MNIDLQELSRFLDEAHRNTYANKDAPKAASTRDKSEDYHFAQGDLVYHDTYFGDGDFIGEEIVYKIGAPIWGMNYYGYLKSQNVPEKDVYDFLRESLMRYHADAVPVRGPSRHHVGAWEYANVTDGNLDRFSGTETISLSGTMVYKCWYHGGLIH